MAAFLLHIFSRKINGGRLYLNVVGTLENENMGCAKQNNEFLLDSSLIGTEFLGELHNFKADIYKDK